jgi:adenylyltransferase/sulfurtransferase
MIKIIVPTPLRGYTSDAEAVEIEAGTVGEALEQLAERYTELRRHLFADDGRLRSFVNIYLNDEDIRYLEGGESTGVRTGDEIRIIPSIAGGATTLLGTENVELTQDEIRRYARHLIMPEVGMEGQLKLKQARVLLVGAGGLGSPASLYLAAAGVGTLGLVDFDVVEHSNLQRQIIHGTGDVGRPKLESARDRLLDVNPEISIETHAVRLASDNALEILDQYDIIVDGTDNFPTRYLVNDACVLLGKPNVYGSIFRFEGQASVFFAKQGPCYRCLYQEPPPPGLVPSCAEGGVLGVLPGIIGALQANEAIKLILGAGDSLIGRLLLFDAMRMRFRELRLRKDPDCPICGDNPTISELIDYEAFCGLGEPEVDHQSEGGIPEITAIQLKARLDAGDSIRVIDVREPYELSICGLEAAVPIPLRSLPNSLDALDSADEIVVICRSGRRSADAVRFLQQAGFARSINLVGGLLAWSDEVDPSMPKY